MTVRSKAARLLIIVYLAPERGCKWSRSRPQASGGEGPPYGLVVSAADNS